KRINSCHALANDKRVDVMGALVSLDRLKIGHMAEDGVLARDAGCAQYVARHAGALESHPDVIAFGHRDVLLPHLLLIFHAADWQHEQLHFRDRAYHSGSFALYPLARGDGLLVYLLS